MTNEELAKEAADLERTRYALLSTRKELESARGIINSLMNTFKGPACLSSDSDLHGSSMQRYAVLLAIGALAAWQVYLTLQLKVLIS